MTRSTDRLSAVEIDEESLPAAGPDAEHERRVAVFDLVEDNRFGLEGREDGPYTLRLSGEPTKLVGKVSGADGEEAHSFSLSLTSLRGTIRDYFMVCETYYEAIRNATPYQIESVDMARRSIHNEGSELILDMLKGAVETDFETARRLFTLVCALHPRQGRGAP